MFIQRGVHPPEIAGVTAVTLRGYGARPKLDRILEFVTTTTEGGITTSTRSPFPCARRDFTGRDHSLVAETGLTFEDTRFLVRSEARAWSTSDRFYFEGKLFRVRSISELQGRPGRGYVELLCREFGA